MPKKNSKPTVTPIRSVYEMQSLQGRQRLEATTTAELAANLSRVLPDLDPYAARAAARLVAVERATITTSGWSLKRLGRMVFLEEDAVVSAPRATPKSVPVSLPAPNPIIESSVNPTQQFPLPAGGEQLEVPGPDDYGALLDDLIESHH